MCREELSVKEGIQDRITRICREKISKLQTNELSQRGVFSMVDNTKEYCRLGKNGNHWTSEENREEVKREKCQTNTIDQCCKIEFDAQGVDQAYVPGIVRKSEEYDVQELYRRGEHQTGEENREWVRRRKCQTNKIDPSCKVEFDEYKEEMCRREFCEPMNRSGYGRSHKYRSIDIERDANEMNVNIEILLGQDCVNVKLLLDTGAQRSFISTRVYEAKLEKRTKRKKCYVRMYGVGGQELATTGEVELDVQLGTDIARQKFIIADIVEDGILGFDFCKAHQAEWKWADDELHLDVKKSSENTTYEKGRVARITTRRVVIVPPRSEIVTVGIIQGKEGIPEIGMIQPQGKFLEEYQLGVAAALGRREGNSVPLRLINMQEKAIILQKNVQVGLFSPASIVPEEKLRRSSNQESTLDPVSMFEKDLEELNPEEQETFYALIKKYGDQFMVEGRKLGKTSIVKHKIYTGEHAPIKQRPRREPLGMRDIIKEELQKMEEQGVIEPSNSPWASPVVLVKKKDGTVRFCIDYRKVNEVTEKDAYPLPRIEDNLDSLKGAKWFSTLDLASGYWQVEMEEEDKAKTAFCTKYGLFQFNVMPFGLCNAPGTFERLMETVLRGMQWERAVLYLDDIIIFSETIEDHMQRVEEILIRLKQANLMLKPSKCHFFKRQVEFLGHIVSQKGVETDPKKIKDVKEWPIPRRVKDVRSFLGLTGYYRRFIKDYGSIAKPLHELTEKNTAFEWTKARNEAFEKLKVALTSSPILGYPSTEIKDGFILDTDASNCHIYWSRAVTESRWRRKSDSVRKQSAISTGKELLCHQKRTLGSGLFCSTFQALPSGTTFPVENRSWSINMAIQF